MPAQKGSDVADRMAFRAPLSYAATYFTRVTKLSTPDILMRGLLALGALQ